MTENFEMAALLESLRADGDLDSSGSFTFDPSRAGELLEKYRLPAASYFMLHAVGAAVASGSSRVEIWLTSSSFELQFDGAAFTAQEDEHCLAGLWSGDRRAQVVRLRELALARVGATQWSARPLRLGVARGRQWLRTSRADLGSLALRLLGPWGRSEEENLLSQHLVPTPSCTLHLNRRTLPGLSLPSQVIRAWGIGGPLPELNWPCQRLDWSEPGFPPEAVGLVCRLPQGEESPARMGLSLEAAFRSYWPGYLDLILNARLYRCRLPARFSNWWATFWVSGLHRDLSHTHIASEELDKFQRLLDHCAQQE